MVRSLSTAEIIAKASRGYIKDYYVDNSYSGDRAQKLLRPNQSFDDLLSLLKDHTFNTEVNILVDAVLKEGYSIHKRGNRLEVDDEKKDTFDRKLRGYRFLKQVLLNLIVYRNGFAEPVVRNGRPDELHVLETTEMNINVDEHGEILGYTQIHSTGPFQPKQVVFFSPEEAIHIAPSRITTNPWGYVDTRSIRHIVEAKAALEDYIADLFKQNRFRDMWVIKNSTSTDQVKNFISSIKEGKIYPDKDIVVEGDVEQKQLRSMADFQYMLSLLDEYKRMIREFLRVPPIMSGGADNKSTGEFQVRYAFDNTVVSWQKLLEDELTYELFPRLGWSQYQISFNTIDKPSEKAAIEQAVQLKGLGFNDKTVHEYLLLKGVSLPSDAHIKTLEERQAEQESMAVSDNKIIGQKLQNMNAPSRKPRDKSLVDKNVSEKRETRQEQVTGK